MKKIRKQVIIVIFTLIFAVILCGMVSAASYTVGPGQTYTTIHDAVNVATDGDSIQVNPNGGSSYTENIIINHNLTLTANGQVTVQPADTTQDPFDIEPEGSGTTIQGFTISTSGVNSLAGISLRHANNCKILNNTITGFGMGIILGYGGGSSNNEVSENIIDSGASSLGYSYGIDLAGSNNNIVSKNTIKTTGTGTGQSEGIALSGTSQSNIISGNTIYTTHTGTGASNGILLAQSSSNTISGNMITASGLSLVYGVEIEGGSNNNNIIGNSINAGIGVNFGNSGNTGDVINFNRIIASSKAISNNYPGLINAQYNWYGSNVDPSGKIQGNVNYSPWLVFNVIASPSTTGTGGTSNIIADLTHDSSGNPHDPVSGHFPDGILVSFSTTLGSISNALTSGGKAVTTLNAGSTPGIAVVNAAVDNQTVTTNVTINQGAITPQWKLVTYTYPAYVPVLKWYKSHGKWKFRYVKIWVKKWYLSNGKLKHKWIKVKKYKKVYQTGQKWELS